MAQIIKIKRSTGSQAPSTLAQGELAYSKGSDTFYVGDPETANTPIAIGGAIKNNAGTPVLATGITAGEIRTLIGVDTAGTDNSTDVTLGGSLDYLTLSGQEITLNAIDLAVDTTGTLAIGSGGTGATTASGARTALSLVPGTDVLAYDANLQGFVNTFTLPTVDADAGQVLTTDGSGNIQFSTVSVEDVDVNVANLTARLAEITTNVTIGDATDVTVTTSGDLVVTGDLTVSGTTTTVNTETINLADNIITLNSNEPGTPSENAGIEVERGTTANTALRWNETDDRWQFTNDGTNYFNIPVSSEYTDNVGTVTSIAISSTDGSVTGGGTLTTSGTFDLQVGTIDGGTYP